MSPVRQKIFYVANARMPTEKAHGIQLAKMCEAFVEQGVDLTLVVPRVRGGVSVSIRGYYGLRIDVPTIFLPVLNVLPATSWGFTLRGFSFAVSSFFYVFLKRLRHGRDSALVYTIDLDQFSYFLLPLAGFSVFFEAHGGKRPSVFLHFFLRRVRGVVTNSGGTRDALLRDFALERERIRVEPNGIDLVQFAAPPPKEEARRALGLPPNARIALYVGRFYKWKGLGILVEAAERLSEVEFLVVGGSTGEFQATTGLIALSKNLRCVGGKPPQEIPLWLAAADVLLVLGTQKNEYSWRETSPMKLFEYMAARRPIVASRTLANQEIVSEEESFFYASDDTASLVGAIEVALRNTSEAAARARAAAEKVIRWSWSARARRVLDFLQSLC